MSEMVLNTTPWLSKRENIKKPRHYSEILVKCNGFTNFNCNKIILAQSQLPRNKGNNPCLF